MGVIVGVVVGDAADLGVHVGAAQVLGADRLAGGGLHQRRAAEEDGALVAHDDRFISHRRHVGAAGGARAHHHGDLRDALGGERGLVVENAPEMVAVGEHLVLVGQVGAARVDQVDARKAMLAGDLLGAQVFLHGQWEVGAALDRGVVGDDHALDAGDPADSGDHAGGGHLGAVDLMGGQRADLEKRRALVEQMVDAIAHE